MSSKLSAFPSTSRRNSRSGACARRRSGERRAGKGGGDVWSSARTRGNRAVTSRCGAADVLEALGGPIDLSPELAVGCLRETGFVFLFAPLYHPAMMKLGPLRRALGFRTIFNLCGPLTNPAHARIQVVGVLARSRVLLVGRALVALGSKRAFVVHGSDGIDELTTTGESVVARVE